MFNLQPGQTLGPYQIVGQIGKGGMAAVFKAYHPAMDRYVALKVLAQQFDESGEFLGRFQQEARLIARLEHAHILPVYDFGESNGIAYLVMRLLDAGTLKDRLSTGLLSTMEVDRIFTQLAEALAYAHDNGVIHRDIKPSNVMLDRSGAVFLTDFGIAKLVEGSPQFTATGAITGTPAYMSPEQAQGLKLDARTDVYSAGIVLYEMLTGRVPYEAETPLAVILKQLHDPLPPPSLMKGDLHPALEAVVLKALAKNPEERYADMHALLAGWRKAYDEARQAAPTLSQPAVTPSPKPAAPSLTASGAAPVAPAPTTLAKPTPPEPPAVEPRTVPLPPKPRRPGRLGCLAVGGAVLALLALICGAFTLGRILPRVRQTQQGRLTLTPTEWAVAANLLTPTAAEALAQPTTAGANDRQTPVEPTSAPVAAAPSGTWYGWTAAHQVSALAFNGDEVYAGGEGGVTVWNRTDQSYWRITTADGLPGPWVSALYVDELDGTLWVGTDSGLAHFTADGVTIYNNDNGLDSNTVMAITRVAGNLWVGTAYSEEDGKGVQYFDGNTWTSVEGFPSTYEASTETVSRWVTAILGAVDGHIWVATDDGVAFFNGEAWQVYGVEQGLPAERVFGLFQDREERIWALTAEGGAATFDGEKFTPFADLNDYQVWDVYAMTQEADGRLWFVGTNIACYNPNDDSWQSYAADAGTLPVYGIITTGIDDSGRLYFGSESQGMWVYGDGEFEQWRVENAPRVVAAGTILPAPDGQLWFVNHEWYWVGGIDQIDPQSESWSLALEGKECCDRPMFWDAQGRLWSGGDRGLWILEGEEQTLVTTEHGLPSDVVTAVYVQPDGLAWVGTEAGLAIFDGQTAQAVEDSGLAGTYINFITATSDGAVWVGTDSDLGRRDPDGQWQVYNSGAPFDPEFELYGVSGLAEDQEGGIWVATYGAGLYRFMGGEWYGWQAMDPGVEFQSDYLTAITAAPDGTLWIGVSGYGVVRYNFWDNTWEVFNGAPNSPVHWEVYDIYAAEDGSVWFATAGGISRYWP